MIIQQTTHIVFEYPQDYLQEQEWCKTKTDEWIHVGTDTRCSIYENKISYSIGQPNNSEKPNNCEVKNYCDDCLYTDTCDSKEFFYACTSKATISKMEQVEDEPQKRCDECIHFDKPYKKRDKDGMLIIGVECDGMDEPCDKWTDEPQTEPLHTCSVNGRPYSECSSCEHFKCTADEPQTDCPWK